MVNTVENELGPHLSKGSLIFGSSNAAYANLTSYWITYIQPDFEVIVEVAAESDISKVVSNVAMQRLIVHAGLLEYAYRFDIAVTTVLESDRFIDDKSIYWRLTICRMTRYRRVKSKKGEEGI
jgi:hypothetical protein